MNNLHQPMVQVSGLRVVARSASGDDIAIVKDVGFSIEKGEVLALIGESGSGKTTIALSLMGYARSGCHIIGGAVRVGDQDILQQSPDQLAKLRGRHIAYIAQSAASAFNPAKTLMNQVIESAMIHGLMSRTVAQAKAIELFRALALPDPEHIGARYPHQVSGGQLQRVMAAMAFITDPALVILDEPTTALDVTTQIEVLRAFKNVVRQFGTTAVYVSHDLSVVAQMADRIIVLRDGAVQEDGVTAQILTQPAADYTKSLLDAAAPILRSLPQPSAEYSAAIPLLELRGVSAGYGRFDAQGMPSVRILTDINLSIRRGASLGVIGESGSGKTTLARVVAGLVAPARGSILLDGQPLPATLAGRSHAQFRRIQFVFQNADTALNPAHRIEQILARPLTFYHGLQGDRRQKRIAQLLDLVRLPASVAGRLPSELSGGQKQRVNLARALAAEPDLILCDEITSALDTVVAAAILDLMADLRRELNLSTLFISHDINTVRAICDDIIVLYAGHQLESRPRSALAVAPYHPYAHLLISSVPVLRQGWLDEVSARNTSALPKLVTTDKASDVCAFLDRCTLRVEGVCNKIPPPPRRLENGAEILCHHDSAALLAQQPPLMPTDEVGA